MKNFVTKFAFAIKSLAREDGQDLVEYALVVALIAFAAAASMQTLASDINNLFAGVGDTLTTYAA
jgi:pilus assembly protein Flp/PilA